MARVVRIRTKANKKTVPANDDDMPDRRQPNKRSYFKHRQHDRAFPHGETLRRNMLLSTTGCGTMEDTGDGERAGFQLCRPHIGRSGTPDEDREESDSRLGSAAAHFHFYHLITENLLFALLCALQQIGNAFCWDLLSLGTWKRLAQCRSIL